MGTSKNSGHERVADYLPGLSADGEAGEYVPLWGVCSLHCVLPEEDVRDTRRWRRQSVRTRGMN